MTLEAAYYLAQIFGVLVIIASLGAVYWQVRQTNKIARATLTQSTWLQTGQMQVGLYDTPAKAELMHRALTGAGPLSESERWAMFAFLGVALGTHETAFNLRKRGLIEESAYRSAEWHTRSYLRSTIVRKWWARTRHAGKDPDYVALIDHMIAEIDAGQSRPSPS
jgi:hypothetical protein